MKALRPKELELMSVFWEFEVPLTTAEIKEQSVGHSWSDSSLGAMITRLVKFGFLEVVGKFQKKNIICNTYQTVVPKDKYYGELISESIGRASPAFVLGFLSNLKASGDIDRETVEKMQQMLDTWKD